MGFVKTVTLVGAMLLSQLVVADLVIEVTDWVKDPTKIAIVPFRHEGVAINQDMAAVVAADLMRSGQFEALPRDAMYSSPSKANEVHYRDWRALGVDYLLIGHSQATNKRVTVEYELFDVHRQKSLIKSRVVNRQGSERAVAHKISDSVYERLTGIAGAFSTRMLYVSVKTAASNNKNAPKQVYQLILADADGARAREILKGSEPILSPSWSPDGKQIAYVSFESSRPAIYRQVIATGEREKLTNFRGLNSAPSWSPDGKRLAMVLSKDGNPELYVMEVATRKLQRITKNSAIDTEPSWMPDGKSLIFTSDRGGRPQIYRVDLNSGATKRITYTGAYNAKASLMADGKSMVMVHRDDSGYHIAWQELATGRLIILTDSSLDESPSLSPNGSMLLYATKYKGRGVLAAVSLDGGVRFRLPSPSSDVREPAWSPN